MARNGEGRPRVCVRRIDVQAGRGGESRAHSAHQIRDAHVHDGFSGGFGSLAAEAFEDGAAAVHFRANQAAVFGHGWCGCGERSVALQFARDDGDGRQRSPEFMRRARG